MKTLVYLFMITTLAGCSSFKLGTVLYCPFGASCALQTVTPQPVREAAPEPAEKPASASA